MVNPGEFVLVLEDAMRKVSRDAGVENVGARAVGHDVDEKASVLGHVGLFPAASSRPEPFFRRREGSGVRLICSMREWGVSVTSERRRESACG